MPTFDTPEPIHATIEVALGHVQINASDRSDTVVEIRPTDPDASADVDAARQVKVDHVRGELSVIGARQTFRSLIGRPGSVDVVIDLPTGSRVRAKTVGTVRTDGRLGESHVETGAGSVHLDRADRVKVRTGAGDVSLGGVGGHADVTTGTGRVRVGDVDGSLAVRTAAGSIEVLAAAGDVRLKTAAGDITVEWAEASVVAKTSAGSIRIGEVGRGTVVAESGFGELEIGIRPGTAAWIDARSKSGRVRSDLDAADEPGPTEDKVEVRAHTGFGDVLIRRSNAVPT